MSEIKECLFYIDHNPPKCCGTWGGAIHKGACKLNSTDCKYTDKCFVKDLYKQLQAKEQECEKLKFTLNHTGLLDLMNKNNELKQECEELKDEILSLRKDDKKACDYCVDYITKEKQAYKYKQALDEIYNVVFIDDINCEVSKEVQDLSNVVINIINKAKDRKNA